MNLKHNGGDSAATQGPLAPPSCQMLAMGVNETVLEWGMLTQIRGRKNAADMSKYHAGAGL